MTLMELRLKHPRMIYKACKIAKDGNNLTISHEFLLEPDIVFRPKVTIPYLGNLDQEALLPLAFNLGLVEAISYWKAACPAEFVVEAGILNQSQIRWWQDLFLHGLGEFFYRNNIDFTQKDFFRISSSSSLTHQPINSSPPSRDLVLVGGGKDSAVTLGLLQGSNRRMAALLVNPTQAALDNVKTAGTADLFVVKRTIDPKLLELNQQGYLNGHTPFSAYLAFLGALVAALHGYENVMASNERSAEEGNVVYRGLEVNHQYSKSFRFEQLFREYCVKYLTPSVNYFSFLRPLNELQISRLFSRLPQFFLNFRSCNVGQKTNSWCGACAKCAFSYATLFPFVDYEQMLTIFGSDYYAKPEIINWIRQLTGLTKHKPFECVGTQDEARLAVALSVDKYKVEKREVPEGFLTIWSNLNLNTTKVVALKQAVLNTWGENVNLPTEHLSLLRSAWERFEGR